VRGGGEPARPRPRRVSVGSGRDDVVALQAQLKALSLATSLAVEACADVDKAAWGALAARVLSFVSTDPGSINSTMRDQGLALAAELASWGDKLRAAGCTAPIPAPPPLPPPPPNTDMWDFSQAPSMQPGGFLSDVKGIVELVVVAMLIQTLQKL
jgi:hypothetical protein